MPAIRTKQQAFKMAQKKWGAKAAVRDSGKQSPLQADREVASVALKEHRTRKPKGDDPSYKEWRSTEGQLLHAAISYRYAVGYIMPMLGAFLVCGQGDTWDEAFAKAREA